ncbi:hypothetical protein KEM48_009422 [Puccinia striiformis f. sp. tritici PST-130]|nr:hypothetical protein KEM48_009422 [Puccinia striiformis f. sp. tritici PST-130]
MITTLYTVLADIHVCDSAFQTEDGGYTPGKGQAACLTSSGTFLCDINACQSGSPSGPTDLKKMFFTGCSLGDNGVGTLSVYVLSYGLNTGILQVSGKNYPSNQDDLLATCLPNARNRGYYARCNAARCKAPGT